MSGRVCAWRHFYAFAFSSSNTLLFTWAELTSFYPFYVGAMYDLWVAACAGDFDSVERMLATTLGRQRVNLVKPRSGRTPLMFAAERGHPEVARRLLESGADPNIVSERDHYTALACAVNVGYVECVKVLLEAGADVKHIIKQSCTISGLHHISTDSLVSLAIKGSHVKCLELVLRDGADPNFISACASSSDGGQKHQTMLLCALESLEAEAVILLLLRAGADPCQIIPNENRSNIFGHILLKYPPGRCKYGYFSLIRAFIDHGCHPDQFASNYQSYGNLLRLTVQLGNLHEIEYLLEHGADPLMSSARTHETTLMRAVTNNVSTVSITNKVACVRKLLDHVRQRYPDKFDAYINAQDAQGRTALMMCHYGMDILLMYGAKTSIVDHDGWTAFGICLHQDTVESIKTLLEYGADPSQAFTARQTESTLTMIAGNPDARENLAFLLEFMKGVAVTVKPWTPRTHEVFHLLSVAYTKNFGCEYWAHPYTFGDQASTAMMLLELTLTMDDDTDGGADGYAYQPFEFYDDLLSHLGCVVY